MKNMFNKYTTLFIRYTALPEHIKDIIRDYDGFRNDVYLNFNSEFEPYDEETYSDTLSMESLTAYYNEQVKDNDFSGTLDEFIKEYGLEMEVWLMEQNLDLSGVQKILIHICW